MCYIGSELWECKFDGLLGLIKEYIVNVWEIRKHKLYDSLHRGRGVVSSVRMVSLVRMISLVKIICLVRKVTCI